MEIQKAKLRDCPILAKMNYLLIRDEGHRNPMNQAQLAWRMKKWLEGEYSAYLVKLAEVPIGYCLYRKDKEFVYIRQFFIERVYRKRGLGRKAFNLLRKQAWEKASLLRMEVLVRNKIGIRFWKVMGFKDYCLTMERTN
jgi:predicted acetyltransferase